MDVQCGVCATEYELDDALLSDRGTVVRCTNCGHQFRVFPPENLSFVSERWVVFTRRGERMEYSSLRELQHALTAGYLGRTDEISRGQGPRRPLGSIAELDGFFRDAAGAPSGNGTLAGIAPPSNQPLPSSASPALPAGAAPPAGGGGARVTAAAVSHGEFAATQPSLAGPASPSLPQPVVSWSAPSPGGDAPSASSTSKETLSSEQDWLRGAAGPTPMLQSAAMSSKTTQVSAAGVEESSPSSGSGSGRLGPAQVPTAQLYSIPVPMSRTPPVSLPGSAPPQSSGNSGISGAVWGEPTTPTGQSAPLSTASSEPDPPGEGVLAAGGPASPRAGAGGTLRLADSPLAGAYPAGAGGQGLTNESSMRPEGVSLCADPTIRAEDAGGAGEVSGSNSSVSFVDPRDAEPPAAGRQGTGRGHSGAGNADPTQSSPPRHRSRSPLAIASIDPEPAPSGHGWMWFAVVALLPVLATGGVLAWKHVQRVRSQHHAATVATAMREDSGAPAAVLSLIEQGRLDEAASTMARASAGRPEAEWAAVRVMLEVGRAELEHYRSCWDEDRSGAAGRAALQLRRTEEVVAAAAAVPSARPGVEAARVRLDWIRSRSSPPTNGSRRPPLASNAEFTDRLARVLASNPQSQGQPRALAQQLGEVSRRELGFGPARAATVAAWLDAGEVKAAVAALDGVGMKYRDELWHVAARFVEARSKAGVGVSVASTPAPTGSGAAASSEADRVYDNGARLALASDALRSGRVDVAERHYRGVLEALPENSEALTGLARIARARGENAAAAKYFDRALRRNPGFLPALQGRADLLWDSGNRAEAVTIYRGVLEKSGPGSAYGRHAAARIEAASELSPPVPLTPPPSVESVSAPVAPEPTPESAEPIGTPGEVQPPTAAERPDGATGEGSAESPSAPVDSAPVAREGEAVSEGGQ